MSVRPHPRTVKRETRNNIIFLGLFLAISLPGAVILFKKKLDPQAPPMYLPQPVRQNIPYMAPAAGGMPIARSVPEGTAAWVGRIAAETGIGRVLAVDGMPVVSDGHTVQLLGVAAEEGGRQVALLVWDERAGFVHVHAAEEALLVRQVRLIDVPREVREELKAAGFIRPPQRVLLAMALVPAGGDGSLRVEWGGRPQVLRLP